MKRFLPLYAAAITCALFLLAATPRKTTFDEITVERINIVEPNGTLRMVISNHARLPGIIVRGTEKPFARPQAGVLFYNDEGSENGGLIFGGRTNAKGEVVDSGGSLTFDKYEANQIVQLAGVDDHEDRFAGLSIADSPTGNDVRRRVWVGRRDDGAASVALSDANGKRRLVLSVSAEGNATVSFYAADGTLQKQLTP
jgi:hypothetical protein